MTSLSFLNQFGILIIDIVGILIAFWVISVNFKNKINIYFALMVVSYLSWISFYYVMRLPGQVDSALLWAKLGFTGVFIFTIFLYLFSIYFLKEELLFPVLNKIIVLLGLILSFISIFTNFIAEKIQIKEWGVNPVLTKGGAIIFFGFVILVSIFILARFFNKYKIQTQRERLKIQYILLGFFCLILANVIFNILLPINQGDFRYSYFGNYSIIFFLGFTAYAIVKQNLFGIRVVLTQILVGVIAILLFVQIIDSKSTFEYIWKGALFLTFIIFGYLLIRSVLREIKLREELEKAYVELQKLDKAKSEFISIASHQLRTPLAVMKGYISMILEENYGPISAQIKTKLQNVFQSNERLIKMVNDLLNISRIESGRIELNIQETPIEDVITGVVEILKLQAKNKKLDLVWEKPAKSLPKVLIDPDKTSEVILNIIDNAIKYTQEGTVEVSAQAKPNSVLVSIADTGAGMSEEEMAKAFKSFSRGAAGNQFFTEGMGLGLYIARQFTEMQKGKIWAESKGKGKGSTFFIELPID